MRPWRKKPEEKIFCSAGEGIVIRGKILLIIYLHPNLVCLPSRHNHCLMERLPLKGAGVIGTSSSVKELTLPLASSCLSSHSFFLPHPAGAQWPPLGNYIQVCSLGTFLKILLIKNLGHCFLPTYQENFDKILCFLAAELLSLPCQVHCSKGLSMTKSLSKRRSRVCSTEVVHFWILSG